MPVRVSPKKAPKRVPPTKAGPVRVSPPVSRRPIIEPGKPVRYVTTPGDRDDDGGGLGGTLRRIPGDFGRDIYQAAVGTPAGLYYTGKAVGTDAVRAVEDTVRAVTGKDPKRRITKKAEPFEESKKIGGLMVRGTIEDFRHPLRHPGYTALDLLGLASLGAGTASRASTLARTGSLARKPGVRTFRVGDLEVQHPESRAALTRGVQSQLDKRRQRQIAKNPTGRAAKAETRKAGRALAETLRAEEAVGKADAAALAALGKRLKPQEQYALRVVAEEAPLNKRIAATRESIANSRGAERRRHAKRLQLLQGVGKHIVDADGKPEFGPGETKLRAVYQKMSEVAGSRETLAKDLGLLTDEAIDARKTSAGRAAMGARWSTPAHEAIRKLDMIESRRVELRPKDTVVPGATIVKERPRTRREWEEQERKAGRTPEPAPSAPTTPTGLGQRHPDQGRLDALDAALGPLLDEWGKNFADVRQDARVKGYKRVQSRYEYQQEKLGRRKVMEGVSNEDLDVEGLLQEAPGVGRLRTGKSADDLAYEILSQVVGRDKRFDVADTETLLDVHRQLTEQGIDMRKLRKALDEREELIARIADDTPDPDEVFGPAKGSAAAYAAELPDALIAQTGMAWKRPARTPGGMIVHESKDGKYRIETFKKHGEGAEPTKPWTPADVGLFSVVEDKLVGRFPSVNDAKAAAVRREEFQASKAKAKQADDDPEYADVDEEGQLGLGVPGEQRSIVGMAEAEHKMVPRDDGAPAPAAPVVKEPNPGDLPKWRQPVRDNGTVIHESTDGEYRIEEFPDGTGAALTDRYGQTISTTGTVDEAKARAKRNAEVLLTEKYGTVTSSSKKPDKIVPGVHTAAERAELDELARQERVAAAEAKQPNGRRQPRNVPNQLPIETLDQPGRAKQMNKPRLVGHDDFVASPDAVYIPDVEQKVGRSGRIPSVGASGTIGHLKSPIHQGYTGAQKRQGREPLNTTRAVAEAKLAVSRFQRLAALRGKLVKASAAEPRFADDIAIRLDRMGQNESLPKDVRQFLDEPEELANLTPEEQLGKFEALRSQLIVGGDKEIAQLAGDQLAEFRQLQEAGKIGWVPKRLLGELAKPHAPLSASAGKVPVQVIDAVNNAQRLAVLYLKPAYAVPNLLGNFALNLVQQGFAAPKNLARASTMHWKLGPELTGRIDTLMHEGFAAALRGETGAMARGTQAAANVWGKGVDRPFRRASFLHEAHRSGHNSPQQLERLLTDPVLHDELIDVTKRANRQIIDYGRLSHRERELIRRVIFFYPWVKGSTVYAGNMLMEYPGKSAVIGAVGREGYARAEEERGPAPSYLSGTFPAGGGLVNPASAAILQTPVQVGGILAGLTSGNVGEAFEPSELMSPALAVPANLIAGKNLRTGREFPRTKRGLADVAYDTLVTQTPQYRLYEQLTGRSKARLFPPSPRAGLMQYLLGGIYPRDYDPDRLRALAKRERKELAGKG